MGVRIKEITKEQLDRGYAVMVSSQGNLTDTIATYETKPYTVLGKSPTGIYVVLDPEFVGRTWVYEDPDGVHEITDAQIIETYFPYWLEQMKRAGYMVTTYSLESCIEDFALVTWATEKKI